MLFRFKDYGKVGFIPAPGFDLVLHEPIFDVDTNEFARNASMIRMVFGWKEIMKQKRLATIHGNFELIDVVIDRFMSRL
jgi:hypothetical protein